MTNNINCMRNVNLIINEEIVKFVNKLISESRESKNIAQAKNYIRANYSNIDARDVIKNIEYNIPNVRLMKYNYIKGVSRLFIDGQLNNVENTMNKYLYTISRNEDLQKQLNQQFNGMNFSELEELVDPITRQMLADDMENLSKKKYNTNTEYKIIPIDSYEEAAKYNKYTKWCVVRDEKYFNKYTHNGTGRFYFCLKDGFENTPKESGENCPLDEYGLSMIATSVNEDGSCNTITCRWNHYEMNKNDDHIMTPEELSEIIGMNYYDVFKPYSSNDVQSTKMDFNKQIEKQVANVEDLNDLFDYVSEKYENFGYIVGLNHIYNILTQNGRLLSDTWFDGIDFKHNLYKVRLNNKINFMDKDGNLVSSVWFDDASEFNNGCYKVGVKEKQNIFHIETKYNVISQDGRLLSDVWFDDIEFKDDIYEVMLDEKYNFMTKNGRLLSYEWFDVITPFGKDERTYVVHNGIDCYLTRDGYLTTAFNDY